MNIFQRMSAVTKEISTVAKNLSVDAGKSSYKAVGEADVLAAVKPIEAKHGVYSYPYQREIVESGEMVSTTKYGERKQLFLRVKTVYRFVNVDEPNEYIDITTYGDGVDTQDKAPGKAMTYGDKYALLKAYKIQTGDDPDQNASDDLKNMTGKPAYPTMDDMVEDVEKYLEKDVKMREWVASAMKQSGCNSISEMGEKQPNFIKACWNKWCNK